MSERKIINIPIARSFATGYSLMQVTTALIPDCNIIGAADLANSSMTFTPQSETHYLEFGYAFGGRMYSSGYKYTIAIYKDGTLVQRVSDAQSGSGTDNGMGGGFIYWVTSGVTAVSQTWKLANTQSGGTQLNGGGGNSVGSHFYCKEWRPS